MLPVSSATTAPTPQKGLCADDAGRGGRDGRGFRMNLTNVRRAPGAFLDGETPTMLEESGSGNILW
jgi:hypothetical protein